MCKIAKTTNIKIMSTKRVIGDISDLISAITAIIKSIIFKSYKNCQVQNDLNI